MSAHTLAFRRRRARLRARCAVRGGVGRWTLTVTTVGRADRAGSGRLAIGRLLRPLDDTRAAPRWNPNARWCARTRDRVRMGSAPARLRDPRARLQGPGHRRSGCDCSVRTRGPSSSHGGVGQARLPSVLGRARLPAVRLHRLPPAWRLLPRGAGLVHVRPRPRPGRRHQAACSRQRVGAIASSRPTSDGWGHHLSGRSTGVRWSRTCRPRRCCGARPPGRGAELPR